VAGSLAHVDGEAGWGCGHGSDADLDGAGGGGLSGEDADAHFGGGVAGVDFDSVESGVSGEVEEEGGFHAVDGVVGQYLCGWGGLGVPDPSGIDLVGYGGAVDVGEGDWGHVDGEAGDALEGESRSGDGLEVVSGGSGDRIEPSAVVGWGLVGSVEQVQVDGEGLLDGLACVDVDAGEDVSAGGGDPVGGGFDVVDGGGWLDGHVGALVG